MNNTNLVNSPLFLRLLEASPLNVSELSTLIQTAPTRYKCHKIVKRKGGTRLISQPTSELKFLQRILLKNELNKLRVSNAAMAYVPNKSIKHHAELHARNRYLLKLDFKEFFPSIKLPAIDKLLRSQTSYTELDRYVCTQILLRSPSRDLPASELELSIGAPSSPHISNCVIIEFDEKLIAYCSQIGITYSRYADDLALSTNHPKILDEAKDYVVNLLKDLAYLGIKLNDKKTVNVSKKNKRVLTGLVLSNQGKVSIGRLKKRALRAQVHSMINGSLNSQAISSVKGYLSFLAAIDPDYVGALAKKNKISVAQLLKIE